MVVLERPQARIGGEEEVPVLDEVDLGHLAIDVQESVRVLDQLDPESADLDVQRRAELEPNARRGQRRRAGAERRVALDHHDPAIEVGSQGQERRHR